MVYDNFVPYLPKNRDLITCKICGCDFWGLEDKSDNGYCSDCEVYFRADHNELFDSIKPSSVSFLCLAVGVKVHLCRMINCKHYPCHNEVILK
jgi:Zn-finger protein